MNIEVKTAYAEFAVQSNFSFLRAASRPEELVIAAKLYGYRALGLADRNTVSGVVRAWSKAKAEGLDFHPGCRLVFADGGPDVLAYPRDRAGWGRLCRMLTIANERGEKGAPDLRQDDFFEWGHGMSLAVLPDLNAPDDDILAFLKRTKNRFGNAVWLGHAPHYQGDDRWRLEQAAALAQASRVPLMAVNDVLYHDAARRSLLDVVTAIRLNTPVAEVGHALSVHAERHMKPVAEMARLFRRYPQALSETIRFAQTLTFSLGELRHFYPDETTKNPQAELERLAWEGALKRYPGGLPEKIRRSIVSELELIAQLGYAPYFLTVYDIVRFAREERGILCQGRGSAANSTVCFCLHITEVDPNIHDLLFERFMSVERHEPPDIDVDFEHERRDEVMAYIYEKYTGSRTALAAAVTSYRGRSALREVAKAFGLSQDAQGALSGAVWGWSKDVGEDEARAGGLSTSDPVTAHIMRHANDLLEFPRHLSQHVGGFIITQDRLDEFVPIIRSGMEERRMVEWDKNDLDATGILKVDILALGMLSCLRRCFDLLEAQYSHHWPRRLELTDLHRDQRSEVYDMICRADTIGVFQIESRAQMSMLPRLKPREFYDLVIEVAIVRPGPIQGDMVHPYLRRREKKEPVEYHGKALERILKRTLGVPLFQEQVMQIAIDVGGFSAAEADQLRRSMATFQRTGRVAMYKERMVKAMIAKGYPEEFAYRCFKQIEGFGEYGFPESHAASFALLVYASSWFKTFYPDVFCAAILNSQPMGFYGPGQLVRDARDHGIEVRPVDVNFSQWDATLEQSRFDPQRIAPRHREMAKTIRSSHAVRLGFKQLKGLSEADLKRLTDNRGDGYASVRDLWLRTGLSAAVIERLAEADAFRSMGLDRRAALWAARALDRKQAAEGLPLFDRPDVELPDHEPETKLPTMPLSEHVIRDYRTQSFSLKAHPVSFLRAELARENIVPNGQLVTINNGRRVSVVGVVLIRQRPGSAKGVIFMTIEDETGTANIIVWPKVFEAFRPIVLGARLVRVTGKLQSASGVIHVVCDKIEDISVRLEKLSEAAQAVDFRAPTDETKRPVIEDRRGSHPAPGSTTSAMPKGRNFH